MDGFFVAGKIGWTAFGDKRNLASMKFNGSQKSLKQ
jgi:hypothetical protein